MKDLEQREETNHRQRVSTFLNARQVELLDTLSREAKFSGGAKLSHALILHCMVDFLEKMSVDVRRVRSEEELLSRFMDAARNFAT